MRKKKYSFNQLQDQRELLVGARALIEDRTQIYVCIAISTVISGKARPHPTGYRVPPSIPDRYFRADDALDAWIESQLKGCTYYERWMEKYHNEQWNAVPSGQHAEYAREARLRWIDWMIAQIDRSLVNHGSIS